MVFVFVVPDDDVVPEDGAGKSFKDGHLGASTVGSAFDGEALIV